MELSQESVFLLHTFRLGVWSAFLYDVLRVWRRLSPRGIFRVSFEDLVFWGYFGISAFLLMYRENNGSLRWYAVLGVMLGTLAYLKLVSPYFVKYLVRLLKPAVTGMRRFRRFLKKKLTAPGRVLKIKLQELTKRKKAKEDPAEEQSDMPLHK